MSTSTVPQKYQTTTFGDETIKKDSTEQYKGRKDVTDRFAIIDPNKVVYARVHYGGKGVGFILCKTAYKNIEGIEVPDGEPAACCGLLDAAKRRMYTLIAQYSTNPKGEISKPLEVTCKVLKVNDGQFDTLRDVHKEWGLDKIDLIVKCVDADFQDLTFTPARQRLIAEPQVKEKFGAQVDAFVQVTGPKMPAMLGKDLTEEQLRALLGGTAAAASAKPGRMVTAEVADIGDLLS